jgi:hypothetical protein
VKNILSIALLFQLTIAAAIACSSFAAERPVAPATSQTTVALNLVGQWQSFELSSHDTEIKSFTCTFTSDGHLTISGVMNDGRKETSDGHYVVHDTFLEITMADKETQKAPYSIRGSVLTLRDPKTDFYVKFKKIPGANP